MYVITNIMEWWFNSLGSLFIFIKSYPEIPWCISFVLVSLLAGRFDLFVFTEGKFFGITFLVFLIAVTPVLVGIALLLLPLLIFSAIMVALMCRLYNLARKKAVRDDS